MKGKRRKNHDQKNRSWRYKPRKCTHQCIDREWDAWDQAGKFPHATRTSYAGPVIYQDTVEIVAERTFWPIETKS